MYIYIKKLARECEVTTKLVLSKMTNNVFFLGERIRGAKKLKTNCIIIALSQCKD